MERGRETEGYVKVECSRRNICMKVLRQELIQSGAWRLAWLE